MNILVACLFASFVPRLTVDDNFRTRRTVDETFLKGSGEVASFTIRLLLTAAFSSCVLPDLVLSVLVYRFFRAKAYITIMKNRGRKYRTMQRANV